MPTAKTWCHCWNDRTPSMSHFLTTLKAMESSVLRVTEESSNWVPTWPDADVVIIPGIPGWSYPADEDKLQSPYPTTTIDMAKILRSEGLTVEHALPRGERQEISLKAAEYWLPVLVFSEAVNTTDDLPLAVDLLIGAITKLLGALLLRRPRLNVRFGQGQPDGTVDFFEAHGDADSVFTAMRTYEEARISNRKKQS